MLPHVLFEWSAYAVGFGLYWRSRDRVTLPPEAWRRLAVVAAAVAGAAVGSKLLYLGDYSLDPTIDCSPARTRCSKAGSGT
jgi:hypothetical protein